MTTSETAPTIVPDFGDEESDRKIAFVCSKGSLDMAYPALVMASGALEHLSDMGCKMWACQMSVDMFSLTEDAMYDRLDGILNVADFIEIIDGAQTMLI